MDWLYFGGGTLEASAANATRAKVLGISSSRAILVHPPFGTVGLLTSLKATLPAGSDPLHGIDLGGDESCFGTPSHDELSRPAATCHTVNHHRFAGRVVFVHQVHKTLHLSIGRHAIVGHIDVMVGKLTRHILPIVELAAVDHRPDVLLLVDLEDIRIWPPGGRNDVLHDPGKRLGSFGLSLFRPIPGSDRLRHVRWSFLHSDDRDFNPGARDGWGYAHHEASRR